MPRLRRTTATALVLLVLGSAGCGLGGSSGTGAASAAAPGLGAGAAGPGGSTAPAPVPTLPVGTSPPADPDVPPEVVLQAGGLGLLDADASVVSLPFGAAAGAVRQALERSLGPATVASLACPQGPRTAVDVDGFRALVDGGRFVGWTDRGAPDRSTTTAEGVGAGARLQDAVSALPGLQVAPAPPGGPGPATWTAPGGLRGTADGVGPTSTVTAVSAGEDCPG